MAKSQNDKSRLINLPRYIPELAAIINRCPLFESSKTDLSINDFLVVKNVGYALIKLRTYNFPALDIHANFRTRNFMSDPLDISAVLVTKHYNAKRPCLILSHGSGGNTASEWQVAQRLMHKFDLNVFILDHYTQRGIKNTIADQFQISIESQMIDLAQAKKFAEKLDFVDAEKIIIGGVSRGGTVVDRLRRKKILKTLNIKPFAAYICFYPLPHAQELRPYLVKSPALYIIGDKDDITPLHVLKPYLDYLAKFGYESELHVAEGAFHAFEYPGNWKLGLLNLFYNPTPYPAINQWVHKLAEKIFKVIDVIPLHNLQTLKESCYIHDERGFLPLNKECSISEELDLQGNKRPFSELVDHVRNNVTYGGRVKLSDEDTKRKAYAALYGFMGRIVNK